MGVFHGCLTGQGGAVSLDDIQKRKFADMKHLPLIAFLALAPVAAFAADKAAEKAAEKAPDMTPSAAPIPAGNYTLDPAHASLIFSLNHLGFSNYTRRFKKFDATLNFDPQHPEKASVTATIDVKSLETDYPDTKTLDFNAEITGDKWLDAAKFPEITYKSTAVDLTGGKTAVIHGNLTLHGVTKPVDLQATFNGGWAGMAMDPNARIGFAAHGKFKLSDFGLAMGIPAPGTTMGVGDEITVQIDAEFKGPPLAK